MKRTSKILALLAAAVMCFSFAGCGKPSKVETKYEYTDTIERPEIDMPEIATRVKYPAKPDSKPATPAEGVEPSVKAYLASEAASPYTVTNTANGKRIAYSDVSDWSYVYVQIENYSPDYGNFKITLNNDPENKGTDAASAERIAVQAVYYEAYELGYSPVTVFSGELIGGEQYVIADLGETLITDESFGAVAGQSVRNKTVLGFVVFIDSLPSMPPANGASGTLDILNFQLLKDGDPALEDRYVKPIASFENAEASEGITVAKGETLTVSGTGSVSLPLDKYTPDFAKFTLSVNGTQSEKVKVGVRYSLKETYELSPQTEATLTGSEQDVVFDFNALRPASGGDDMESRLIKYGDVTHIVLSFDSVTDFVLSDVKWTRTATDGAYVADSWTSNSSSVTKNWAYEGGNAGFALEYHTAWNYVSVPVRKGEGIAKIVLTLYAPDGLNHLGVGVVNNSPHNSAGQNKGSFIVRRAADVIKGADTEPSDYSGEKYMQGITETIAYSAETKTYTLTYDFSKMKKDDDEKTFADYTTTAILFYMNCPCGGADAKAHEFEGTRSLYFMSIQLLGE